MDLIDIQDKVSQFIKEKNLNNDVNIRIIGICLVCLANKTGANLEECLQGALDKYEGRYRDCGHLGSRGD